MKITLNQIMTRLAMTKYGKKGLKDSLILRSA